MDAEEIEKVGAEKILKGLCGILVPGGFGERGIEGKVLAAQYAREQNVPYLGLCLGMHIATIEFARNVLGLAKADSTEFQPDTAFPVIALLDEQKNVINKPCDSARNHASLRLGPKRRICMALSWCMNGTAIAMSSIMPSGSNSRRLILFFQERHLTGN